MFSASLANVELSISARSFPKLFPRIRGCRRMRMVSVRLALALLLSQCAWPVRAALWRCRKEPRRAAFPKGRAESENGSRRDLKGRGVPASLSAGGASGSELIARWRVHRALPVNMLTPPKRGNGKGCRRGNVVPHNAPAFPCTECSPLEKLEQASASTPGAESTDFTASRIPSASITHPPSPARSAHH